MLSLVIVFVHFLLLVEFGYKFIYWPLPFVDGEMISGERMSNDTS